MTQERGHALRWTCPECGSRITGMADTPDAAEGALIEGVREHSATHQSPELSNPVAQAQGGGWLAAAGHRVELWGGPFDGDSVWCPPGDLPPVVGIMRTADGAVVPTRSATVRLLPHVAAYRLGDPVAARAAGRPVRYIYDGRPR